MVVACCGSPAKTLDVVDRDRSRLVFPAAFLPHTSSYPSYLGPCEEGVNPGGIGLGVAECVDVPHRRQHATCPNPRWPRWSGGQASWCRCSRGATESGDISSRINRP